MQTTQPGSLPDPTSLCRSCRQTVLPNDLACPWCGTLNPRPPFHTTLPDCFQTAQVSLPALRQSQLPLTETTYLAVGGGLGSFAWIDTLRVCGAATSQIAVIGREPRPYGRFQRLCTNSQISGEERIRSDSGAMPDNLWGWPGYAVQEIGTLLWQNRWRAAAHIAWQIFSEPVLADSYAPRAQTVIAALEREMRRIGWRQMFRRGEVWAVRQTNDGRYVVLYEPAGGRHGRAPQLLIAPYLHLALGHAGIQLSPEIQAYRRAYDDRRLVVQAYEDHEQMYDQLAQRGGLVILRGRGIVASRILQRLDEIRQATGQAVRVIHLIRTPVTADTTYGRARRQTEHQWQLQPFNWPKAAFGGDLRVILEEATPEERQILFATWGGSTTSTRHDWREVVRRGQQEGWYSQVVATIAQIQGNGRNRLIIHTQDVAPPQTSHRLIADFLIDCTGLNDQLTDHPLLADLSERYGLPQNANGRLVVTPDFELKGLRNGYGQAFMAGAMTFGNEFAPVDSFLGLQYAAQRSVDALIRERATGLHTLNYLESLHQWWRWCQGLDPADTV